MCMSSRESNSSKEKVSIISSVMPYKVEIEKEGTKYIFECSKGNNITVSPPMKDSYLLSDDFKVEEHQYNISNKTIDEFLITCKIIYASYICR